MVDRQINETNNTGMTTFGGQRHGSWFYPMGKLGRFFAKFFASKAVPHLADTTREDDEAFITPHPLAGDTVVNPEPIKAEVIRDSDGGFGKSLKSGRAYPILNELEVARRRRYREYEEMDEYPEISTAFDIYADDSTQRDLHGEHWSVETKNLLMKKEVEKMFKQIKLECLLWDIVRNTAKYGDCFTEIIVDLNEPKAGVQKIKILNPNFILRIENEYGYLTDFLQEIPIKNDWDAYGVAGDMMANRKFIELDKNQIVHIRLHTSDPFFYPYGRSIAAGTRSTFRSLKLMEDAMLIYRLQRAPERRVFYIDVGQMPTSKAEIFMEKIKQKFKKEKYYDNGRSTVNERYNPLGADEDFFVPIKGKNAGTKIETLPGAQNLGDVDDVRYFRDKLLASLKIPKDYVVEKDKSPERKANLSQLDVKFARTVSRVQKNVEIALEELARRHLTLKGYGDQEIQQLKIRLPEPSDMFLKRKLDIEEQRTVVVQQVLALGIFSKKTVFEDFYNFNDIEIEQEKDLLEKESNDPVWQKVAEQGMGAPPMGGAPGMPGEDPMAMGGEPEQGAPEEPQENKPPTENEALANLKDLKNKLLLKEGADSKVVGIIDNKIKRLNKAIYKEDSEENYVD